MSKEVKPPTIVSWKINHLKHTRQVVVICPHCGEKHCHGWPYDDDSKDIGHRVADCFADGGYFIVPPANYKKQPPSKT